MASTPTSFGVTAPDYLFLSPVDPRHQWKINLTNRREKGKHTHSDFSPLGFPPMKAQHDNLQPMAPIRPLKETWLDEVLRAARREVDASVCQAVAVQKQRTERLREDSQT